MTTDPLAFELTADERLEARRRAIFDSLTGFNLPSWATMRAELGEVSA